MLYTVDVITIPKSVKERPTVSQELSYEADSIPDLCAIRTLFDEKLSMILMVGKRTFGGILCVDELQNLS